MDKKRFTVLGGDQRSVELAYLLIADGNEVQMYGFDKLNLYLADKESLDDALIHSDVVVGPLPFSNDEVTLNTPFFSGVIQTSEILDLLSNKQVFTAGKINLEFQEKASYNGLISVDYFDREDMQILNAIPTAEGAIQVAMENMKITLHSSNSLVLGYGRIGKALSKILKGIGSNVFVEARDYGDIAWIKNNGYTPIPLKELRYNLSEIDVIFNTIPNIILDETMLNKLSKNCLIVDLASKPGGVDLEKAKEYQVTVISAQGLPGKVAPITAARVIKDTIYNIIEELEV